MPETPLTVWTRKFSSLLLTLGLSSKSFLNFSTEHCYQWGQLQQRFLGPTLRIAVLLTLDMAWESLFLKGFLDTLAHPVRISQKVKKSIKDTTISLLILWRSFFFEQQHQFFPLSSAPICCPTSSNFFPLLVLSLSSHLHHGAYSVA